MEKSRVFLKRLRNLGVEQTGAVAAYAAIGIVVFLGLAALTLDIGHIVSVKGELQKAADAGALAGARGLWPLALPATTGSRDPDCTTAQTRALQAATLNQADGSNLAASEVTVEVGQWNYATKQFTAGISTSANGVRVTTRRNNVLMLFAQFLGVSSENLSASATAVMDFANSVGYGCLPIAVNREFTAPNSNLFINFTPDPNDNAGWFTDPPDTADAKTIRDYIDNASCPSLAINDIINLQNGNDASCLQDLAAKLAENGGTWLVCLPVVDTNTFNQSNPITDFVGFTITQVQATGTPKGVTGTVMSMAEFANALPGGGKEGALAPPKLVQ